MDDPVAEVELATEIQKLEDESVREYFVRVGEEANIDTPLIDDASTYATEVYFSEEQSGDRDRFNEFVNELRKANLLSDSLADRKAPAKGQVSIETGQAQSDLTQEDTETGEKTDVGSKSPQQTTTDTSSKSTRGLTGFRSGLEGTEPRKLLVLFIAILATAPLVGWLLGRAWVPGNTIYEIVGSQLSVFLGLPREQTFEFVAMFGFGLFLGLLVLFTIDPKKRVQGMLLLFGSAVGVFVMGRMGVFLPNIEFTAPLTLLGFLLGLVVGGIVEGGQLAAIELSRSSFQRPTREDGRIVEFRTAAQMLFILISLIVFLSLIQVVLANSVQVSDPFAAGIFLVLSYQFIQYESETSYTTIGPERSGKSTMLLALCLELFRNAESNPNPNTYLASALERASNIHANDPEWPLPSTAHDEARVTSFEVIAGNLFPRRLQLTALDYAGQHLGQVAEILEENTDDSFNKSSSTPGQVAEWINQSESLIFILDVERLVFPEKFGELGETDQQTLSWGLEHYTTIIEEVQPDDVIVVATKCDILVDQDFVQAPAQCESYNDFTIAVTEYLSSRPDVEQLLSVAGEKRIHPIYIETRKRDGEYVPKLDDTGNLNPVGYDHLINEIKNRQ